MQAQPFYIHSYTNIYVKRKLVFDADGLIKLAKSGALEPVTGVFECMATKQVEREAVTEGKRRLYEDAFETGRIISLGKIKIMEVNLHVQMARRDFGVGELSVIGLYKKIAADAIVSDDKKFLALLAQESIPFVTPTQLIVGMAVSKKISVENAQAHLSNIKQWVTQKSYVNALKQIGG